MHTPRTGCSVGEHPPRRPSSTNARLTPKSASLRVGAEAAKDDVSVASRGARIPEMQGEPQMLQSSYLRFASVAVVRVVSMFGAVAVPCTSFAQTAQMPAPIGPAPVAAAAPIVPPAPIGQIGGAIAAVAAPAPVSTYTLSSNGSTPSFLSNATAMAAAQTAIDAQKATWEVSYIIDADNCEQERSAYWYMVILPFGGWISEYVNWTLVCTGAIERTPPGT